MKTSSVFILKMDQKIVYIKTPQIVKAILIDYPQVVLKRILTK